MAEIIGRVIAYAEPDSQPRRPQYLECTPRFFMGMLLGIIPSAAVANFLPTCSDAIPSFLLALVFLGICVVYVPLVIIVITIFSRRQYGIRSDMHRTLLGFWIPIIITTLTSVMGTFLLAQSQIDAKADVIYCMLFVPCALLVLFAPFRLLIRNDSLNVSNPDANWRPLCKTGLAIVILFGLLWGVRIAALRSHDRQVQEVIQSIKESYPSPGVFKNIPLPKSNKRLSENGLIDAVHLPDGRIIVLLKTDQSWHSNWTGIIYSSAPITPAEIGTDAYNRPTINIKGVEEHFIQSSSPDRKKFWVSFDLG